MNGDLINVINSIAGSSCCCLLPVALLIVGVIILARRRKASTGKRDMAPSAPTTPKPQTPKRSSMSVSSSDQRRTSPSPEDEPKSPPVDQTMGRTKTPQPSKPTAIGGLSSRLYRLPISSYSSLGAAIGILSSIQLGRKYPKESDLLYTVYRNVLSPSKLGFKPKTGMLGYEASFYIEGLLRNWEMPTLVHLMPEVSRISVTYVPKSSKFVTGKKDTLALGNWINERIRMGRFYIRRPAEQKTLGITVRDDLIELAFDFSFCYIHLTTAQICALIKNYLDNLVFYHRAFSDLIQAAHFGSVELDHGTGRISGERAAEVMRKYDEARHNRQQARSVRVNNLMLSLKRLLDQEGFQTETIENEPTTTYRLMSDELPIHPEVVLTARITPDAYLLLESRFPIANNAVPNVAKSGYLAFVNALVTYTGVAFVDRENATVVYRTGIDVSGFGDELDSNLLLLLLVEHVHASPWVYGFKLTAEGRFFTSVVQHVVENYQPDQSEYLETAQVFWDHVKGDSLLMFL